MSIISMRKRAVAPSLLALLLLILPACTRQTDRAQAPAALNTITSGTERPEIDEYKNWPKFTLDAAQQMFCDEAKAILIARAAIEQHLNSDTFWEYELRFRVQRSVSEWSVSVGFFKHSGGRVQQVGVVPVVRIDKNWNAQVLPGA